MSKLNPKPIREVVDAFSVALLDKRATSGDRDLDTDIGKSMGKDRGPEVTEQFLHMPQQDAGRERLTQRVLGVIREEFEAEHPEDAGKPLCGGCVAATVYNIALDYLRTIKAPDEDVEAFSLVMADQFIDLAKEAAFQVKMRKLRA